MTASNHSEPIVSIVLVTQNQWQSTFKTLMAVTQAADDIPHEVIIVDNASVDETRLALPHLEGVRYTFNDRPVRQAEAKNQGAKMARGRQILFLHPDTEPQAGFLSCLSQVLDADDTIGVVGSRLVSPAGLIEQAGMVNAYGSPQPMSFLPLGADKPAMTTPEENIAVNAISSAAMLVRTGFFLDLDGFDDDFDGGDEDIDFCLRTRERGMRVANIGESLVNHHRHLDFELMSPSAASQSLLHMRWYDKMQHWEADYRADAPAFAEVDRAPFSVVVVGHNPLMTIVPCLENLRYGLGPDDEIILVDQASNPANRRAMEKFVEENPDRSRLVPLETFDTFTASAAKGLAVVKHAHVVVMAANLRAPEGFLDRVAEGLEDNDDSVLLTPRMSPEPPTRGLEVMWPPNPDVRAQNEMLGLIAYGDTLETDMPGSSCFAASKALVSRLIDSHSDVFDALAMPQLAARVQSAEHELMLVEGAALQRFDACGMDDESVRSGYITNQATRVQPPRAPNHPWHRC